MGMIASTTNGGSRRGSHAWAELFVGGSLFLASGFVVGASTGSAVGMVIAMAAAAAVVIRQATLRVSTHDGTVSLHGWVTQRRFTGLVAVKVIESSVGRLGLPVASVAIELSDNQQVELGILRAVPLLKAGDAQARRSAAWLAGRLGMVQVDEDSWRRPSP